MSFAEIFFISLGLAMDAFAVAICKGISVQNNTQLAFKIAFFFGGFQALMPLLGFFLGTLFNEFVATFGRYISSGLLILIGCNMLKDARKSDEETNNVFTFGTLLLLSIATSIDAFSVGIALAFVSSNIFQDIAMIGFVTFFLSFLGVKIGKYVGKRFQTKAPLLGGILLILLGIKNFLS